jgi:hypothetical protein
MQHTKPNAPDHARACQNRKGERKVEVTGAAAGGMHECSGCIKLLSAAAARFSRTK